jgi:hypothetical protein
MDAKTEGLIRQAQDRAAQEQRIAEVWASTNIIRNEDGTVTIKLFEPLTVKDKLQVSELKIRRPKPKDLKATDKIPEGTAKAEALLERLCGIPMEYLTEMDLAEFNQASFVVADMVGKFRGTGANS